MPFTFSHPAIILPLIFLLKRWFSLTGLIIGSMSPDFEYFLRMKTESVFSHTTAGIFFFDLPISLLLAFLFHNWVRNSLFLNLPIFMRRRVSIYKEFKWTEYFKMNWIAVIVSIIIGAASHIFWDSFTHETGYFVVQLNQLQQSVELFNFEVPIFKILQHLSSLVGAGVIAFSFLSLPQTEDQPGKTPIKYWLVFVSITLAVITIRLVTGLSIKLYGHIIVSCISASLIASILTPAFLRTSNGR